MYLGATMVRNQSANPDTMALSAHGFRELMEKLPRLLDVPMAQRLTSRMGATIERWKRMANAPAEQRDGAKAKFCEEAEKLISWYVEQSTERNQRAGAVMDRLDQRKAALPQPAKAPHVATWNACLRVVETAAHHGSVTPEVYEEHVQKLEDFLIDRLRPSAVDDQRTIEDIVREGEEHA